MKKKIINVVLIIAVLAVIFVSAFDQRLKIVHYTVQNENSDNTFRIAFISDLHSCYYGENMSVLIESVRAQNPDIVLFGGDIFDNKNISDDNAITVLKTLGSEFYCLYVSGNHEVRGEKLDYYKEIVSSCNVTVLDGTHTKIAVSALSSSPDIYGFDDVTAYKSLDEQLDEMRGVTDNYHFDTSFNILLIHRPELIENYSELGFDLVLSGHTHGGQWRFPFVQNGIYAPGQGFFPKYSGGYYDIDGTVLIVSRGLARESTPLPRIFNRPELVIIDIV